MSLAVITPAYYPNEEPLHYLRRSCVIHDVALYPYGVGKPWHGDIEAHFEGAPEAIRNLPSNVDLVLFTDACDSFLLAGEKEIRRKFEQSACPVLLAAEQSLYPWGMDKIWERAKHNFGESDSPWHFPNGGGWIGTPETLLVTLEMAKAREWPEAQGKWIEQYSDGLSVSLDAWCQIFQTMSGEHSGAVKIERGKVTNTITGTNPCVIHWNGKLGGMKEAFKEIYGRE